MTEIKPVYQYKTNGMLINYWQDVDEEIFVKINKDQFYTTRIIYPAAAYEALQKENEALIQKLETAAFNHFSAQERIEAQAKRIAELESELVEWNEFKKIRDAQMQSLRKQMP